MSTTQNQGKKYDVGKIRWDLLVWDFINAVASVLTFGAKKYGGNNWQGIDAERYFAALHRHLYQYQSGQKTDTESGLSHLAHAGCNLMFLYFFENKSKKIK